VTGDRLPGERAEEEREKEQREPVLVRESA
jgi:hypothetical protein